MQFAFSTDALLENLSSCLHIFGLAPAKNEMVTAKWVESWYNDIFLSPNGFLAHQDMVRSLQRFKPLGFVYFCLLVYGPVASDRLQHQGGLVSASH